MARTKWKCVKEMPRSKKPCGKTAVTALYCKEHHRKQNETLPVFTIGKRSKIVVNRLLRRLRRRKPSYVILTEHFGEDKLFVDTHGWVSKEQAPDSWKRLSSGNHIKTILRKAGYETV